jgi:hypothetical protein
MPFRVVIPPACKLAMIGAMSADLAIAPAARASAAARRAAGVKCLAI